MENSRVTTFKVLEVKTNQGPSLELCLTHNHMCLDL